MKWFWYLFAMVQQLGSIEMMCLLFIVLAVCTMFKAVEHGQGDNATSRCQQETRRHLPTICLDYTHPSYWDLVSHQAQFPVYYVDPRRVPELLRDSRNNANPFVLRAITPNNSNNDAAPTTTTTTMQQQDNQQVHQQTANCTIIQQASHWQPSTVNEHDDERFSLLKGQSEANGATCDKCGNPQGNVYDLARDGAFSNCIILIGNFCDAIHFPMHVFHKYVGAALQQKGFQIIVETDPEQFASQLSINHDMYTVAWVIDSDSANTQQLQIVAKAITTFRTRGKGVHLWADNVGYVSYSNAILQQEFADPSLQLVGSDYANQVMTCSAQFAPQAFIKDHYLSTGCKYLYEGVTISYPCKLVPQLKVFAMSCCNKPCIMYCDKTNYKGRLIMDCGFTKMLNENHMDGTCRYVTNAAAWLSSPQ